MRKLHLHDPDTQPAPLSVLGETITVFGQGDQTKPFEVHVQAGKRGGGPPPHFHPWDEAFYVLEGEVALTVDDTTHVLGAGGFVHIPGGTVHAYKNVSDQAKMLAVVSDPKGGRVFAEYDREVRALPRDMPKVLEIGRRYGVTFLVDPAV